MKYVPALDGLRAVAVVAVVSSHSGHVPGFGGGFMGVDMFFVLSGYLITTILTGEYDKHGRVDVVGFYLRRFFRLVPALLFMLAAYLAVADTLFGNNPRAVDHACVPSAVFSHPPMCGVGLTESAARNTLGTIKVYTSDFRPMKNVLAGRNERSLYKMICDAADERIVGIHLLGPDSPEILQAAAVAVKAGLTKADFDATVAIHPTMAEELVLMR